MSEPTLNIKATTSAVEQLLFLHPTKESMSHFYILWWTDVLNVQDVAQTWQSEPGVNTDRDEWDVIWNHRKENISVCPCWAACYPASFANLSQHKI